jgi:beta-glucosidase
MTPQDEGEEYTGAGDRTSFALDGKQTGAAASVQNNLITSVAALKKPMVVVLEGGSVIDMPWLSSLPASSAVVMAWYPGMDGGHALGDLLFGNANFGGKLPVTWGAWADEPEFSAGPGQTTVMGYYLGYRWFDTQGKTPTFPFGAGLSYTKFAYSNLFVPCSSITTNGVADVTVDVTNTGSVTGDEVSFLFVSYPNTAVANRKATNYKELKGFHRVTLTAGETQTITFPVRVQDLKYWNTTNQAWAVESGAVNIMVGGSSANLPLKGTLTIN